MTRWANWWPYIYFLHAAILASICFLCQGLDGLVARLNVVISISFGNLCQSVFCVVFYHHRCICVYRNWVSVYCCFWFSLPKTRKCNLLLAFCPAPGLGRGTTQMQRMATSKYRVTWRVRENFPFWCLHIDHIHAHKWRSLSHKVYENCWHE